MFDKPVVSLNNLIVKLKKKKCLPESLLLLFPHCIQNTECKQNIKNDLNECKRCGKCRVKNLMELAEKYGVSIAVASGGRVALERVKADSVKGVVAIACEKELRIGIMAAIPKAIIAVPNLRPNGYCKNTDVLIEEVEKAVEKFVSPRK